MVFIATNEEQKQNKQKVILDLKIIAYFLVIFLAMLATIFAFSALKNHHNVASDDFLILPYDGWPTFFNREQWGAKPALNQTQLQHPVDLVIVAHTVTTFCRNFEQCSEIITSMQNYHFNLKMTDIGYNFLIGGDGNIYEGRGWDFVTFQNNHSISVSFIGNFLADELNLYMIDAFHQLMIDGVKEGKLSKDYKIVCHNQTKATLSPGENVYKVVKMWPHFRPGILQN
ncbi:peptidoglycan-recognition protein SC1a-like [Tribolium madens]|uniref:peptidoglycan-recognition protein SC1a-like n=1 Tax=Tribolium madens TaxID=41895 RepID=UPI001CF72FEF|nr:peptidoglycan-recognition protein SC1a-like [Tribolium madens]